MKVAGQFTAWELEKTVPSRRDGLILTHGWLVVRIVARLSDPIIPYPTGRCFVLGPIPGSKLPG